MSSLRYISLLSLLVLLSACGSQERRPSYEPRYYPEPRHSSRNHDEGCEAYDRDGYCLPDAYHGKPIPQHRPHNRPYSRPLPTPRYRDPDNYDAKNLPRRNQRQSHRRNYERQAESLRRAQQQKKQQQDRAQQQRHQEQQRLKRQSEQNTPTRRIAPTSTHETANQRKRREYEQQKRQQYCQRNVCRD